MQFPTTNTTWIAASITDAPEAVRVQVMERYFQPLCAYARASSLRMLGEPEELVNEFLAARLADSAYLTEWLRSGIPLRRWLANGLLTHARNRALAESRRRAHGGSVDPAMFASVADSHATDALLALERVWTIRTITQAYESVRASFEAEGRGAWWDLFRLHSMQGMPYANACRITGVAASNATNVHRAVVARLRETLARILERDGIPSDEFEREIGLMQDFLGQWLAE